MSTTRGSTQCIWNNEVEIAGAKRLKTERRVLLSREAQHEQEANEQRKQGGCFQAYM